VLQPLASAEAVMTQEERDLGGVLVDIGGGTTDVAIFLDGSVWHTAVLPVGGANVLTTSPSVCARRCPTPKRSRSPTAMPTPRWWPISRRWKWRP
jgi:cell division protein FtsA